MVEELVPSPIKSQASNVTCILSGPPQVTCTGIIVHAHLVTAFAMIATFLPLPLPCSFLEAWATSCKSFIGTNHNTLCLSVMSHSEAELGSTLWSRGRMKSATVLATRNVPKESS